MDKSTSVCDCNLKKNLELASTTAGFMCSCVHLITLHRAFPVEANHMRQAFATATAAPHGGHVIVKEWTVICSSNRDNILIFSDVFQRLITIVTKQR